MADERQHVPGWVSPIVPEDLAKLEEWFVQRVEWFRDFPKRNPTYWIEHRVGDSQISVALRKPSARHVKARLRLAEVAITEVHRWLNAKGMGGQPDWPAELADERQAERELSKLLRFLRAKLAEPGSKERTPPRRYRPALQERPLTGKQTEAAQVVAECKGNIAEAARRLGKDPKTVRQHYGAAMKKLGTTVVKHATKQLPSDRRGQVNIADGQDRR